MRLPRRVTTVLSRQRTGICVAVAVFASLLSAAPASAQVVVVVNGAPITALDIEHRTKLIQLTTRQPATRQQAIEALIDDKLKIFIAKRYGMEVSDSDVDANFAETSKRMRMTPEQLAQSLASQGVYATALKNKLRADIVWGQLVRGKFGSTLQVGESDVLKALETANVEEKETGYLYTLRPVVFIVPRGSSAADLEQKRREADALRARFTSCDEGIRLARGLRDVAVREPIVRSSGEVSPQLRELLASMTLGRLTTPEPIDQGMQMFALCDKKESKIDTARKAEVKNQIFAQRFEREGRKFLDEVRRSAMIEYR